MATGPSPSNIDDSWTERSRSRAPTSRRSDVRDSGSNISAQVFVPSSTPFTTSAANTGGSPSTRASTGTNTTTTVTATSTGATASFPYAHTKERTGDLLNHRGTEFDSGGVSGLNLELMATIDTAYQYQYDYQYNCQYNYDYRNDYRNDYNNSNSIIHQSPNLNDASSHSEGLTTGAATTATNATGSTADLSAPTTSGRRHSDSVDSSHISQLTEPLSPQSIQPQQQLQQLQQQLQQQLCLLPPNDMDAKDTSALTSTAGAVSAAASPSVAGLVGLTRPPGLGGPAAGTLQGFGTGGGHSKQSSASTAQSLTLTPASSLDGSADMYTAGRQASPFRGDGPSIPSLRMNEAGKLIPVESSGGSVAGSVSSAGTPTRPSASGADLPQRITTLGSSIYSDGTTGSGTGRTDSLLGGFDGLANRSMSATGATGTAGGLSASSPVRSQQLSASGMTFLDESLARSLTLSDHRRPRAVSKDSGRAVSNSKPPLSGGSPGIGPHPGVAGANQPSDANSTSSGGGGGSASSSVNNILNPGVISRPEAMLDASLRRSISNDTGIESLQDAPSFFPASERSGAHSQALHTSNHPQHVAYRGNPGAHRYERSLSQSDLGRGLGYRSDLTSHDEGTTAPRRASEFSPGMSIKHRSPSYEPQSDMRYFSPSSQSGASGFQQQQHLHPHPTHERSNSFGRSMSMEHSAGAPDSQHQQPHFQHQPNYPRRSSALATGGGYYHPHPQQGNASSFQRRQSLDFVPGQNRYVMDKSRIADDKRIMEQDHMMPPGQGGMLPSYPGHTRHHSDVGHAMGMGSSPASLNNSGVRPVHGGGMYGGGNRHGSPRFPVTEEDYSHPLMGENIEVPGDDNGYMVHSQRPMHQQHHHARRQSNPETGGMHGHYGHMPNAGQRYQQAPKIVYNVKFKRTQRSFMLGPRLNRDLKVGTYVKVEADRGEDLGIVVGRATGDKVAQGGRSSFRSNTGEIGAMATPQPGGANNAGGNGGQGAPGAGGAGGNSGGGDLKRIIRLATHDEVSLLTMKRREEEQLLDVCRTKVQQRGLPMHVVDAEYQFDRHKLTFFFEAEGRIDFRELVRDLFSMCKTRIWMQQLDKTTSTCPTAPVPSSTVEIDYGTPIIAPASEFSEFTHYNDTSTDDAGSS